jgi:DNA adenine methylase
LIVGYRAVKQSPYQLTELLREIEEAYLQRSAEERKHFYYEIRDNYNAQMLEFNYSEYSGEWVHRAAYLIFLNKTCFNGLFRQNQKGEFNVPHGRYKNPTVCDDQNIFEVSKALRHAKIVRGDFKEAEQYISEGTFVYLDPPYRPLNSTSSFTSYSKEDFTDEDQKRLADFFSRMHQRGALLMLSNSDPHNENPEDDFFDDLYRDFRIERVSAKRYINSKASGRGEINELVIRNY